MRFWARSKAEWETKLQLLIEQPDLRKRLGSAARLTIDESYSTEKWAAVIETIFKPAIGKHEINSEVQGAYC